MTELSDAALVDAVRTGDREAYGLLVQRHHGAVCALCYRMAGNVPDAEDLAHQAFVEAYVKLDQLREPEKFLPWLRTVALNVFRMGYRKRKREQVVPLEEEWDAPAVAEEPPDYAQLNWGISRLPARHRIVLVLHYFEGLPYKELAAFLEVPMGTVMSRLHRARKALEELLREGGDEEEVAMISKDDLKQEVDAEIAVLLDMFGDEPEAMERLSLVFERSPDRLAQAIRDVDDASMLDNLALLLPRVGRDAMAVMVDCALSADAEIQARAQAVLAAFITHCRSRQQGPPAGISGMASLRAYILLDCLIAHGACADAKAVLILELAEATEDTPVKVLLTNTLLGYREAALALLSDRFWNECDPSAFSGGSPVLQGLCRGGKSFCQALLEPLRGADEHKLSLALMGLEAIARSLAANETLEDSSALRFANERRHREKWAPLREDDVGSENLQAAIECTAALVAHDEAGIRESAIRVLGLLNARHHGEALRAAMGHAEAPTRRAAVLALADLGCQECTDDLLRAAEEDEPSVRRAAIDALGRLRANEAVDALTRLAGDADAQVRRAAATALGEIGGGTAQATLQEMLRSKDKNLAKAAAKALYRRPSVRHPLESTKKRLAMTGADEHRPVTYRSPSAALQFAVPEIRPYDHRELTKRIAQVCADYATTRRFLVDVGLMERAEGVYELTELGKSVWRVEHFISEKYLGEA